MLLAKLATAILDASKEPPKEFKIFALGEAGTEKGRFLFDQAAAKAVLAASERRGIEYSLDYEHASLENPPLPTGAPAAGWYKIELRADGLWATDVRWTPRASEYLKNGEYRYFSPAFHFDLATRRVLELKNIALTNDPATHGQQPLVAATTKPHAGEEEKPTMKTLLAKLGLKDDSTEAEALAVLHARETRHDELEQDLVKLTGAKDVSEAKGIVAALKAKADKFDAAEAELAKLKAEQADKEVAALVDGGVRDGKITPAQKAFWLEHGKKDVAMLKAFLKDAPKLVTTKETKPGDEKKTEPNGDLATLSADDKAVAKMLGISEKDFLAKKKADAAQA